MVDARSVLGHLCRGGGGPRRHLVALARRIQCARERPDPGAQRPEEAGAGLCDHRYRHPHRRDPARQARRLSQQRCHPARRLSGQHPQLGIRGADRIARSGAGHAQRLQPFPDPVYRGQGPASGRSAVQLRLEILDPALDRIGIPQGHRRALPLSGADFRRQNL